MKNNISGIIKNTYIQLDKKWKYYMSASVLQLVVSCVFILLIPPFGLALAYFAYAITVVGLVNYILKTYNEKSRKLVDIFGYGKNFFNIVSTQIIKDLQILFWSIFMIVPGIYVSLEYSMSHFVLSDNPSLDSFDALKKSKQLTKGYKGQIFLFWLLYLLLTLIVIIFSASLILFCKLLTPIPDKIGMISLTVISLILFIFIVLPFIKVSQSLIYDNIKESDKVKQQKEKSKKELDQKNISKAPDFKSPDLKAPKKKKTETKKTETKKT